jgi:hypothetical protein
MSKLDASAVTNHVNKRVGEGIPSSSYELPEADSIRLSDLEGAPPSPHAAIFRIYHPSPKRLRFSNISPKPLPKKGLVEHRQIPNPQAPRYRRFLYNTDIYIFREKFYEFIYMFRR